MERLGCWQDMPKKDKYFRVRSDDQLKAALKQAAERADRKEADQARYILRRALGLTEAENESAYESALQPKRDMRRVKGGTD